MISSNEIIEKQLLGQYPKPGKTGIDWFIFCAFINEFNDYNLEIGVGHGGSALSMQAYSKKIVLVDSWKQSWKKEDCKDILKDAEFIDCDSKDLMLDKKFDLVHIDAHKDYNGTIHDLKLCEKFQSKVIIVDDFLQSLWPNVSRATFDFIKKSDYKIIFVGNHQAILSKDLSSNTYKNLITSFPLAITDSITHLTYGDLPNIELLNKMIESSNLSYTWQNKSETEVVNK